MILNENRPLVELANRQWGGNRACKAEEVFGGISRPEERCPWSSSVTFLAISTEACRCVDAYMCENGGSKRFEDEREIWNRHGQNLELEEVPRKAKGGKVFRRVCL